MYEYRSGNREYQGAECARGDGQGVGDEYHAENVYRVDDVWHRRALALAYRRIGNLAQGLCPHWRLSPLDPLASDNKEMVGEKICD